MNVITQVRNKAMPKIKAPGGNKTAVYWWNETIDRLRRNCLRQRRKYTRERRRNPVEVEYLHKRRKCNTYICLYEINGNVDDAEHTSFHCTRSEEQRLSLESRIEPITIENIVENMILSEMKHT